MPKHGWRDIWERRYALPYHPIYLVNIRPIRLRGGVLPMSPKLLKRVVILGIAVASKNLSAIVNLGRGPLNYATY